MRSAKHWNFCEWFASSFIRGDVSIYLIEHRAALNVVSSNSELSIVICDEPQTIVVSNHTCSFLLNVDDTLSPTSWLYFGHWQIPFVDPRGSLSVERIQSHFPNNFLVFNHRSSITRSIALTCNVRQLMETVFSLFSSLLQSVNRFLDTICTSPMSDGSLPAIYSVSITDLLIVTYLTDRSVVISYSNCWSVQRKMSM